MGYLAIIIASLLAALTANLLKLSLQTYVPVSLMFFRFFLAFSVFFLVYVFSNHKFPKAIKDIKKLFFCCLLSPISLYLVIYGLNLTTASSTYAILAFGPVFTAIGAVFFLKEKVTKLQAFGVLMGFFGVSLYIFMPILYLGKMDVGSLTGNFLIFLSTLVSSIFRIYSKDLSTKYDTSTITLVIFFNNMIFFGIFTLYYLLSGTNIYISSPTLNSSLILLFLALVCTTLMFYIYQYGLKLTSAFFAGLTSYIQFPISVYIATLLFHDKLTTEYYIGGFFVLIGALFATKVFRKREKQLIVTQL